MWRSIAILLISITTVSTPFRIVTLSTLLKAVGLIVSLFGSLMLIAYLLSSNRKVRVRISSIKPLVFATPAAWSSVKTKYQWSLHEESHLRQHHLSSAFSHNTKIAFDSVLRLILKCHVEEWLDKIRGSTRAPPAFVNAVETLIRHSASNILARCESVDWASLTVNRIVPKLTEHVERFRSASGASNKVGTKAASGNRDALDDVLLASRYASDGRGLHPAVDVAGPDSRPSEEAHLRAMVDDILPLLLPDADSASPSVKIMAREIIACVIVWPLIETFSNPDWWNRLIDEKAGAAIRDANMVSQLRQALDKTASPSTAVASKGKAKSIGVGEISASSNSKDFHALVRSIKKCSTLVEARRLRSDVSIRIRTTRLLIGHHGKHDFVEGQRVEDLLIYIDRLYATKNEIERRIAELGGHQDSFGAEASNIQVSMLDILATPASLSLFTEFMDRRHRSSLVQFWLTVEGLKDPLENLGYLPGGSDLIQDAKRKAQTIREDAKMLWDTYFNPTTLQTPLRAPAQHLQTLHDFVVLSIDGRDDVTRIDPGTVKRSVAAIQQQVFDEMQEEDFPAFTRTALYASALATLTSGNGRPTPTMTLPSVALLSDSLVSPILERASTLTDRALSANKRPQSPSREAKSLLPVAASTSVLPPQVTLQPAVVSRRSELLDVNGWTRPPSSDSLSFLMATPTIDRAPLFHDAPDEDIAEEGDWTEVQTIEAIQDALNSILENDSRTSGDQSRVQHPARKVSATDLHGSHVLPVGKAVNPSPPLASASTTPRARSGRSSPDRSHLNEATSRRPIFDDDGFSDLNHELSEQTEIDDELPTSPYCGTDLRKLNERIGTLQKHQEVLGALVRKAELTGNSRELRVLSKSQTSLHRELREMEFQKEQVETTAVADRAIEPGSVSVTIPGTTIGEADGQSFVSYLIEVHHLGPDRVAISGWFVTRRYSEFSQLDKALKERIRIGSIRHLDLPSKRLVTYMSDSFIESRRASLERYMQNLVKIPQACQSKEVRAFISERNITLPLLDLNATESTRRLVSLLPGQGLVKTLYKTVATGVEDVFAGQSFIDTIIQRLNQQAVEVADMATIADREDDVLSSSAASLLNLTSGSLGTRAALEAERVEGLTAFTAPLCDLFVNLFGLKAANNWLRRQAVLIILQQVMGGTIERKLRDGFKAAASPDHLAFYIDILRDSVFPNGARRPPEPSRSTAQKTGTREAAGRKLEAVMPALAGNLLGRTNARQAARLVFAMVQNARLTRHVLYTIVDVIVQEVFPELASAKPP